jgi:hypothetical protein
MSEPQAQLKGLETEWDLCKAQDDKKRSLITVWQTRGLSQLLPANFQSRVYSHTLRTCLKCYQKPNQSSVIRKM